MTFEALLVSYLNTRSGLTSFVGSRIYPAVAPEGVLKPYIVYYTIAHTTGYTHDGATSAEYTIQFSVFAEKYADACSVRDQLLEALSGYSGSFSAGADSLRVVSTHDGSRSFYEPATKLHHIAVDFTITAL